MGLFAGIFGDLFFQVILSLFAGLFFGGSA